MKEPVKVKEGNSGLSPGCALLKSCSLSDFVAILPWVAPPGKQLQAEASKVYLNSKVLVVGRRDAS